MFLRRLFPLSRFVSLVVNSSSLCNMLVTLDLGLNSNLIAVFDDFAISRAIRRLLQLVALEFTTRLMENTCSRHGGTARLPLLRPIRMAR